MAEYLIQDATLTGIADAIRAKTGGSAAMTPAQMATEIGSIRTGGGGKVLLADYTASEDVSAIRIDFTSEMQGYALYEILCTGSFNKQPYPYAGFNTTTSTGYLNSVGTNVWAAFIAIIGDQYAYMPVNGRASVYPLGQLSYFHMRAYAADGVFRAGFNIKIWGYSE